MRFFIAVVVGVSAQLPLPPGIPNAFRGMEAERKDFGLMLHPPSSDATMIRSELADVETAHDIIAAQRTRVGLCSLWFSLTRDELVNGDRDVYFDSCVIGCR